MSKKRHWVWVPTYNVWVEATEEILEDQMSKGWDWATVEPGATVCGKFSTTEIWYKFQEILDGVNHGTV
jgi:hypothetical protein